MKTLSLSLCALLLGLAAHAAPAKKGDDALHTVLYDYAKWSRAGQTRYVLMAKPITVKEKDFNAQMKALLKGLKQAKKATYGKTKIALKDNSAESGKVWIYLDDKKKQYHPIVMAEVVYTFTEAGAKKVIFPKVNDKGMTRADVPFPAFHLALNMWEGLPPEGVEGVLLRLPSGDLMSTGALEAGLKEGKPKLIDALWSLLETGNQKQIKAAIKAAKHLKLKDLSAKLLPVLKSAKVELREAALDGLEGIDEPETNTAIRAIMDKDKEAKLRDKAAVLLSRSKDPAFATAAQYHALRSEDPKTVAEAAKALGDSKEKEAQKHLLERLEHKDTAVRQAVIASLLKRKESKPLLAALKGGDARVEVKVDIARAFTQGKDKKARKLALTYLVVRGPEADSIEASKALVDEKGREVFNALGEALKHPKPAARIAAAEALVTKGDKKGLDQLGEADVENKDSGAQIEDAMRRLYAKQQLNFVLKQARKQKGVLRRAAVATLGEMVLKQKGKRAKKDVIKALETLAKAKKPEIRAAAARSFESMGDEGVRELLYGLAEDKAVIVKRAVAKALGRFKGDKSVEILLGYAKVSDVEQLANALLSLGALKDLKGLQPIINQVGHKDVRVRRAATAALVQIGEVVEKKKPLLALFSERLFEPDVEVRVHAIDGLLITQDSKSVQLIAALLQDPSLKIRKAALAGLAKTGESLALSDISSALLDDEQEAEVKAAAIEAIVALGEPEGVKHLDSFLKKEKDAALKKQAKKAKKALKKK